MNLRQTVRILALTGVALPLLDCGGSPPSPPPPPPSPASPWSITQGSAPQSLQVAGRVSYFDFPQACAATATDALPCYVSYVEMPYGSIAGRSAVTLSYSITGNAPTFTNLSNGNTCGGPAALSLLLHQAGDNLSGQGAYNYYRWFSASSLAQPLALGDHDISVPLDDISKWTPVSADQPGADAGFATAKANLGSIGFGLGGGCFAAHGVAVASGNARFVIRGFSVQ